MTDNKLNIFGQVRAFSKLQSVAFCATMLERQVPNFSLFCDLMEADGEAQMQKALNQIWLAFESLQKAHKVTTNMALLRDKVEDISPDANAYDGFGVYPAIDCAMAMVATLNVLTNDDENGAVAVSKLSQGSVEAVILASEGEMENHAVKQHPLMQRELEFQASLIAQLSESSISKQSTQSLKGLATQDGATNIGIELSEDGD
jgi:uncharacterized protein YjaG (DUF416 family)